MALSSESAFAWGWNVLSSYLKSEAMKFVKIDPPGTFCLYSAVFDMIRQLEAKSFLEVGCGAGGLSRKLLEKGLTGSGYDLSPRAIKLASENLRPFIATGRYRLVSSDILKATPTEEKVDLGLSMMAMEHVQDDIAFIKKIASFVRPNGHVIVAVPGRREKWSVEDETVGHLRRYDRQNLIATLAHAGIVNHKVWSVAVPIANMLFPLGKLILSRSTEMEKLHQSQREQTESSGIREIPFKTVFPVFCKLILNDVALAPLFWLQRKFYHTGLGLTMLGIGTVTGDAA